MISRKPLIQYTIDFSLGCELITKTIVTTDSIEIAEISKALGAEVPFLRPLEISDDLSRDNTFIDHYLRSQYFNSRPLPDYLALLRPTSPIRPKKLIDQALKIAIESKASCVRAVIKPSVNPFKCWYQELNNNKLDQNLLKPISHYSNEPFNSPRQELPNYFWQTGHLDLINVKGFLSSNSITGGRVAALLLPDDFPIVDIDTEDDILRLVEIIESGNIQINS